jgi:hypothetical protein
MVRNRHRYAVQLLDEAGARLGLVPVTVDWEPLCEWSVFETWRRCRQAVREAEVVTTITPNWHPTLREPFVGSVRVTTSVGAGDPLAYDVATAYFRPAAQEASGALVQAGRLTAGERFNYLVTATADGAASAAADEPLAVEDIDPPLPLQSRRLAEVAGRAVSFNTASLDEFPVYIAEPVVTEIAAQAQAAGATERAGVLLGKLYHDDSFPEIFLEITAQIPAPHIRSSTDKVTFTAETWTAVRAAVELRRQNEIICGSWHNHPYRFWTAAQRPAECAGHRPLAVNFFSVDDGLLHRVVFGKAYCVGLVATNAEAGMQLTMFGWNQGMIQSRSFHIIKPNGDH